MYPYRAVDPSTAFRADAQSDPWPSKWPSAGPERADAHGAIASPFLQYLPCLRDSVFSGGRSGAGWLCGLGRVSHGVAERELPRGGGCHGNDGDAKLVVKMTRNSGAHQTFNQRRR